MNDQEMNDLLIELKTGFGFMNEKLDRIETMLESRRCGVHAEKLYKLEKFTWTSALISVCAVLGAFWEHLLKR